VNDNEHSFLMAFYWRVHGTKRLIQFFDCTSAVKYFCSARFYLLLIFMGKTQGKGKTKFVYPIVHIGTIFAKVKSLRK